MNHLLRLEYFSQRPVLEQLSVLDFISEQIEWNLIRSSCSQYVKPRYNISQEAFDIFRDQE
jgi:hypothetical protein